MPSGTHTPQAAARLKALLVGVVVAALVLTATVVAVRTILLAQVDQRADRTISHEVESFVTFVEGSAHIGNGEVDQFTSEVELMRSFLTRQTPESHEALVAVSGDEVLFLDNAQHDAGRRFTESEASLQHVLQSGSSSGVVHSEDFGEVRWGRVSTDQGGAFVVLHFTTPAEDDAESIVATVAGAGAGSLLLVTTLGWVIARWWPGGRRRRPAPVTPTVPGQGPDRSASTPMDPDIQPTDRIPAPDALTDPDARAGADAPPAADAPRRITRRPVSAANLLLGVQRGAAQAHPTRRILLAAGDATPAPVMAGATVMAGASQSSRASDLGISPARQTAHPTAEVLGGLAGIEAELDVDVVRSGMVALVDHAARNSPAGTAVFLTADQVPPLNGGPGGMQLSVLHTPEPPQTPDPETGSSVPVHPDDAPRATLSDQHGTSSAGGDVSATPPAGTSPSGWELAEQVAAAHQGRCWQVSGSGSPSVFSALTLLLPPEGVPAA